MPDTAPDLLFYADAAGGLSPEGIVFQEIAESGEEGAGLRLPEVPIVKLPDSGDRKLESLRLLRLR